MLKIIMWPLRAIANLLLLIGLAIGSVIIMGHFHRRRSVERKVRYFRPTIEEGIFGKKIHWTLRDEPLTQEQLNKLKSD